MAIEFQLLLAGELGLQDAHEMESVVAQAEKSDDRGSSPSNLNDRLATLKLLKEQDLITETTIRGKSRHCSTSYDVNAPGFPTKRRRYAFLRYEAPQCLAYPEQF